MADAGRAPLSLRGEGLGVRGADEGWALSGKRPAAAPHPCPLSARERGTPAAIAAQKSSAVLLIQGAAPLSRRGEGLGVRGADDAWRAIRQAPRRRPQPCPLSAEERGPPALMGVQGMGDGDGMSERKSEVMRRQAAKADFSQQLRHRARATRKQPTEAERKLWWHLRRRIALHGTYFRRQVPLGRCIVDFCSLKARLVVEVDGGQHTRDSIARYDSARTQELEGRGFTVLRFSNTQVLREIDIVIETIYAHLAEACPQNLPR